MAQFPLACVPLTAVGRDHARTFDPAIPFLGVWLVVQVPHGVSLTVRTSTARVEGRWGPSIGTWLSVVWPAFQRDITQPPAVLTWEKACHIW